jgi:hypothetical protein
MDAARGVRQIQAYPLLLPHQRPIPQHIGQPQVLRLPPVEYRLTTSGARQVSGRVLSDQSEPVSVGPRTPVFRRRRSDATPRERRFG